MSNISIAVLVIYIALTTVISTFMILSKLSRFMKVMWIAFVWMLPFLGSFAWLFIQSFEHKFKMDGEYR